MWAGRAFQWMIVFLEILNTMFYFIASGGISVYSK